MKLKAKKIISLVLSLAMLLSLFCIVPSVTASAETEVKLYADDYAVLTNCSVSQTEKTKEDGHAKIGGIVGGTNANAQTYASLVANGFTDTRFLSYATFRVRAAAAGKYTIKARVQPGGTMDGDYFVVLGVNDKNFYKQDVTTTGYKDVAFEADLEVGVNLVRVFLKVGDVMSFVPSKLWVNFDGIIIPSTLEGVEKGNALTLKAQQGKYYNYSPSGATNLGSANPFTAKDFAYNFDNFKIGDIYKTPSVSFTVTVPESGYYDMGFTMNTSGNDEGYMIGFVDAAKTKIYYKNVEGWSTKNVSMYIPAGTHNITFTNVWSYTGGGAPGGYTDWCDFGELFIRSGSAVFAAEQIDPMTIDDPTRMEAETYGDAFKANDPYQVNGNGSGKKVTGGFSFDYGKDQSSTQLSQWFDKSSFAYVTFVVNAPADGTYKLAPAYEWSKGSNKKVALVVNDCDTYLIDFVKQGTKNYSFASADVTLTKGTNIIRFVPFMRDSNVDGGWLNIDYLDIDPRLTKVAPEAALKVEAESIDPTNIVRFSTISATAVAGANNGALASSGITSKNFTPSCMSLMPYVSVTVTAPEDGWYDISGSVNTGRGWVDGRPLYSVLYKDGAVEPHGFNKSTNSSVGFMGNSKTADRSAIDYTTYLTKGDHVLAFTSPIPYDDATKAEDYCWIDFDGFYFGQGLKVADVQQSFVSKNEYYDIASASRLNYYQKIYNNNKDAGFEDLGYFVDYTAGQPTKSAGDTYENMGKYLTTDATPFVAYAINVPTAGFYAMNVRFRLGCSNAADLQAYYDATGEYPYTTVIVNNGKTYKLNYRASSNNVLQNAWWVSASVGMTLEAGNNIVYLMAPTSEMRNSIKGIYVDYGAIALPSDATVFDADLTGYGDASGDTVVNLNDILRIKKYIADNSTPINFNQANFDGDADVDVNDLVTMKKMVIKPEEVAQYTWLRVVDRDTTGYTVVRSNPDANNWLMTDGNVEVKTARTAGKTNIDVTTGTTYQTIDGFSASITDSAAQNFALLTEEQVDELYDDLFSTTKGDALGINILRQPMGASDYADNNGDGYTYDDMPEGQTDTELANFSIDHDTNPIVSYNKTPDSGKDYKLVENGLSIVDLLNKAKEVNSDMTYIATPWTAPLWMKTERIWSSKNAAGKAVSLKTEYYQTYANYFVKFLKAYADEGIDVSYITAQNECSGVHNITATYFDSTMMNNFIKNNLYPALSNYNKTYSKNVGILGFDFNPHLSSSGYLSAEMMNNYLAGAAFHAYTGSNGAQLNFAPLKTFGTNYPNKKLYVTEAAGNTSLNSYYDVLNGDGKISTTYWNFHKNYFTNTNRTTNALLNKANSFGYWNLMLDEGGGPAASDKLGTAVGWGTPLVTLNRRNHSYYKTEDYYALAHYSKYIRKGAVIVKSTNTSDQTDYNGLNNVVAKNTDGSYVMVINNDTGFEKPVSINTGLGYYIEYTVPARSTITLTWTAAQLASFAS